MGFGDGLARGTGTDGNRLSRHTPHLYNLAWNRIFFWDGRVDSLEAQVTMPIVNPKEMGMSIEAVAERLLAVPHYARRFATLFPRQLIVRETLGRALAAFVRTIVTRESPFDRYMRGEKSALSESAIRGKILYETKASCISCHDGPNFTDGRLHNIGIRNDDPGLGRFDPNWVTVGAFKTPGLRNAALTPPYMHNGSIETLEEVVEHYNLGGNQSSQNLRPLHLSPVEAADLVAFLKSLTDPISVARPPLP